MAVNLDAHLDPTLAPADPEEKQQPTRDPRPALCLSGGGYRAMIFHVGALWRLNQLAWLPRLGRVSSVSGGSITAGVLGLAWGRLRFEHGVAQAFEEEVVAPLRRMARTGVDVSAVAVGALPFVSAAHRVAAAYREHLYGKATLRDLPRDEDGPRFVINATSVQTGALFRFSRPFVADYHVGKFVDPDVPIADAVAASSAFPPFLSPADVSLARLRYEEGSGDAAYAGFREKAVLTDGGVYDNLGLETAWKRHETLLVSDGGGAMDAEVAPAHDWARHVVRVLNLIDNQVRSLRKRTLIGAYEARLRTGTYWGIRTNLADYPIQGPISVPHDRSLLLADEPTRLANMPAQLQERLVNWGYAVCDAAMRSHVLTPEDAAAAPWPRLPYPSAGI
jgi:NTE family protein